MRKLPALRNKLFAVGGGALFALAPFACGQGHPEADPDSAEATALPPAEAAQVRQFLDARYVASDVKHSFHTKFGEAIDCIDFLAQPGVKALAAMGKPITEVPAPVVAPSLPPDLAEVSFNGQPDDEGHPRACPAGTVPILRLTTAHIQAAGGMDSFLRVHAKKAPPPMKTTPADPALPPDSAGPGYAHVESTFLGGSTFSDAVASVSVYAPSVVKKPDHSIAQTWTLADGANGKQSVEVGWNVDPNLYAGNHPQSAHLFIFSTVDGYNHGCYNNTGSGCVPWISAPQATFTPGQTLTNGVPGSSLVVMISLQTTNGDKGNGATGWNIRGVGVYPSTGFNGQMKTVATTFMVGGEVYDQTQSATNAGNGGWEVPMGSGAAASAGFGQAAFWDNTRAFVPDVGWASNFSFPVSEIPGNFTFLKQGSRIFYGDVPNLWWGRDYGVGFSPIGDWAGGSYKGECQMGSPVVGVSANTNGANSNAVLCGQQSITTTGSQCYARTINGVDNRAFNDNGWDWDQNAVKDECEANFYVQGVAQSQSGVFNTILCCPGNVGHRNCDAEVFGPGDSPSYGGGPDWDPFSFKGQCASGKYVAGVSQVTGAVHGLLCCSP